MNTFASPNRDFVLVSEGLWTHFHTRWREIDQEWAGAWAPGNPVEVAHAAQDGIRAAREELRRHVRSLANDYPGTHLVPV